MGPLHSDVKILKMLKSRRGRAQANREGVGEGGGNHSNVFGSQELSNNK